MAAVVGILLTIKRSGIQIGFMKYDSDGMIVVQNLKATLNVFTFKAAIGNLIAKYDPVPMYEKYKRYMDASKDGTLSFFTRYVEASIDADMLNREEFSINGVRVNAEVRIFDETTPEYELINKKKTN